jgi:hypothetical protein
MNELVAYSILLCVSIMMLTLMSIWHDQSHSLFTRKISPGQRYNVGERVYTMPKLPLADNHGPVDRIPILSEAFMASQRHLFEQVCQVMGQRTWWVSGGTLLGFVRHQTFIPFDDDLDIHVPWEDRSYYFGTEFAELCDTHGLETIRLFNASLEWADKQGAAIRVRHKGTFTPTMDIFFETYDAQSQLWYKVDSWSTNGTQLTLSTREKWPADQLFPIQWHDLDYGLRVPMPREPEKVLSQQYSAKALDHIKARDLLISHNFCFNFLNRVWIPTKKSPSH